MTENPNYGETWTGAPGHQQVNQPPAPGTHPGQQFPTYGQPQQAPYGAPQYGPNPQGTYGVPAQPAGPSFFTQLPLPYKLAVGSGIAGVITYFMGFVAWISVGEEIERKAERWADEMNGDFGVPAFLTMVFTPGYFLLFLGAAGVASFAFLVPKWRKYLPQVAGLVVLSWLGLLACALALPSFISLGAGAIIALILGSVQLALIGAAVILDGRADDK
ncbi:MAG: DUF5336 domain-containing protein [Gordonia sp. (in: high G+C Gram-positive bacteria)]|uniref:DUF5336 domain-containing protein n=1 Tax=Gordonia sp. (in: high G+C Gram-positive bacteria) TaxID=84139 RepID=UPI003BB751E4